MLGLTCAYVFGGWRRSHVGHCIHLNDHPDLQDIIFKVPSATHSQQLTCCELTKANIIVSLVGCEDAVAHVWEQRHRLVMYISPDFQGSSWSKERCNGRCMLPYLPILTWLACHVQRSCISAHKGDLGSTTAHGTSSMGDRCSRHQTCLRQMPKAQIDLARAHIIVHMLAVQISEVPQIVGNSSAPVW